MEESKDLLCFLSSVCILRHSSCTSHIRHYNCGLCHRHTIIQYYYNIPHHPAPPARGCSAASGAALCWWTCCQTYRPGWPSRPRSACSARPPESFPPHCWPSSDAARAPRSSDQYDAHDPELASPKHKNIHKSFEHFWTNNLGNINQINRHPQGLKWRSQKGGKSESKRRKFCEPWQ